MNPSPNSQQSSLRPHGDASRKPYEKPALRHEKVFETMALTCGKVQGTGGSCRFNRKNS